MLDIKTKKAINDARDTLVGKIPSPAGQVEQITLAMLYKFMDDMDQEAIDLGGKATFFTGEFEKYSWRTIMSKTLSAQERYNRYTEALEKLYGKKELPHTFREIFKNATVPYKESETLTWFLKIINEEFNYNDSEKLGDAYEYLLSVLGSQGDLGQFRTPRNIIDFMVAVVDPQKDDKILDPACGTAGFLISAYKHILNANTDKRPGDKMTFEERKQVLSNIHGYDIEPSMVKIAEMNLFLHGATESGVVEYDTLTMDEKWSDKYDCILANPPFMTPKGGIRPHNKFSIKASKAEILFVDYIANHLKPNGRAGIIVPDGVVFKQDKSFKQVRKDILEHSLYAVISLPAGVFNPYSGVSTCILLLDKKLNKERNHILFVDLVNDGFSLNAQRKPIIGNEIPELINLINNHKNGNEINDKRLFIIAKENIINNNYDLSINKYKQVDHEVTEYEDPKVIYKRIKDIEQEIVNKINELGELL